jgi:hypothetical protein
MKIDLIPCLVFTLLIIPTQHKYQPPQIGRYTPPNLTILYQPLQMGDLVA